MLITNENYRQALRRLKNDYSDLPWYQRWWFSLWSYSLSGALSAIDLDNPTSEQVDELIKLSDESWFFNSIFGLLTQFKEAIGTLSFSGQVKEIKEEIGSRLPPKDLVALSLTSEENYAFFESMRHIDQFLLAVAHGKYDAVATMLEKNSNLLLHKGRVTDYSGRTFFFISGFQYALWALDKHMWMKILKSLPQNEKGAMIKEELLKQYQELKDKGVAYELNGERIRENHFDFENTIIQELRTQVNDAINGIKGWDEIDKQWREDVGSAQKKLPMHVVYEYCSEEPFDPPPEFNDQPPMIKQFYNSLSNKYEDWFHSESRLGEDFAIYKGAGHGRLCVVARGVRGSVPSASEDLLAVKTLCDLRTVDFIALESLLEEPLAPDDQFSASQSQSI